MPPRSAVLKAHNSGRAQRFNKSLKKTLPRQSDAVHFTGGTVEKVRAGLERAHVSGAPFEDTIACG
jgi:hypothetical protein